MKLGIISDIHGNIEALNKVLKEFENEKVDKIICLGDLVCGANHSEEVVQKIISLKDKIIIVRGNHERYVVEGMPKFLHDHKRPSSQEDNARTKWVKSQLSKSSVEFLRNLPKERYYEAEGKKIYISHYPMEENGEFKKHIREANAEEDEILFSGIDADIFLYGHTHLEIFNVNNTKTYINPGSLGCPRDTGNAPYGILNINKEKVEYEQFHVDYDIQEVIDEILKIKFPSYGGVLRVFYGVEEFEYDT